MRAASSTPSGRTRDLQPYAEHPGYAAASSAETTILVLGITQPGLLRVPRDPRDRDGRRALHGSMPAATPRPTAEVVRRASSAASSAPAITAAVVVFYAFAAFIAVASGSWSDRLPGVFPCAGASTSVVSAQRPADGRPRRRVPQ